MDNGALNRRRDDSGSQADDPGLIVGRGYDLVAERYLAWRTHSRWDERARYLRILIDRTQSGSRVLELGCGAGNDGTRALAQRFALTGVDISPRSVELARQRVPDAAFVCADMTSLDFEAASFDAVAAFYSLTHVPREEHGDVLRRIARWLRPGGLFVATMGAGDEPGDVEDDWLGVPMYFSHFDAETNKSLVTDAGLRLLEANVEMTDEDGNTVAFLWVVAEKQ